MKTHYGHSCSLGYLPIPKDIRQQIADDLVQGISFDKILDNVRDNIGSSIDRSHLITRKDLYNIEKCFGLRKIERHKEDAMSVHLWVHECVSNEKHYPILLYKPQGQVLAEIGTNQGLGEHDFALVVQTKMLMSCGHNKIVCVDATHGTNSYNFLLITVLVMDEFGEGFPVAWCYSNREDLVMLNNFFHHIKNKVGNVHPEWFMPDDASQYYKCWSQVFKRQPKRLLCICHVDRAWRNAISRINEQELQISVYHTLRVLVEEQNTETFHTLMDGAIKQWQGNPKLEVFYKYFSHEYLYRGPIIQEKSWCQYYHVCGIIS